MKSSRLPIPSRSRDGEGGLGDLVATPIVVSLLKEKGERKEE